MLGSDPRAASRNFAAAVVADSQDADALDRARARAARHHGRPRQGQRALRPARQCLGRGLHRLRAAQDPGHEGARARRARRCAAAPLVLAPGDRCAEDEPRARRQQQGARRPTRSCAPSTASAWSTTRPSWRPRPRASACSSPSPCRASQVDFAKFVSVDGKDPQSVSVEGEQLCIEGLTHGERYEVQVRAGLPSDVERGPAEEHRDRRLCARPQAVRALLGQELRAAEPRPAGHPASSPSTPRRSRSRSIASATATSSARSTAATSSASSPATRSRPSSRAPARRCTPARWTCPRSSTRR